MAIDLRSDTVTRPTPEMRSAMAAADVGDDVYSEDPTVNRLQETVAELLGHEAALFVPSGTMGNAIAIRLLTRPGNEVLTEERSHVVQYELAGMAALSGVMPRVVRAADGHLTADHVAGARRPAAYHRSDLALVVLENTHNLAGGTVCDAQRFAATVRAARDAGLSVHLDGARVWNAAVALGVEPHALCAGVDSVMVALSKGLCAPVGSLLAGSRAFVQEARRVRKLLGGGMRQAGVLAAAGLVSLGLRDRLAEDHANAGVLRDALARGAGVSVIPSPTNIVVGRLQGGGAAALVEKLVRAGVLASAMDDHTVRFVTHHDVSDADCRRAAEVIEAALGA